MGQSFRRQTGHLDEGSPWLRDMTDEGQQQADERHSGAQRGAPEDEGQLTDERHILISISILWNNHHPSLDMKL